MKHVVIDLEMNTVNDKKARRKCKMETIEIGAVMLDENLQEISSFRTYVKPEFNTEIAPEIIALTGINDSMVVNAPLFNEALRMFTNWCLGTGDEVTVYAWSSNDYMQIKKELKFKEYEVSDDERIILCNEWEDFQREFDVNLGFERQLSLRTALEMAGISFVGREHDALDDARNTAELFQVILRTSSIAVANYSLFTFHSSLFTSEALLQRPSQSPWAQSWEHSV